MSCFFFNTHMKKLSSEFMVKLSVRTAFGVCLVQKRKFGCYFYSECKNWHTLRYAIREGLGEWAAFTKWADIKLLAIVVG